MKPAKRKLPAKGNHVLQLRLSKDTVAGIDDVTGTVPQLEGFNRSKFIRAAVLYALDCHNEEGYERDHRAGRKSVRH
jgi:hypothetical protein